MTVKQVPPDREIEMPHFICRETNVLVSTSYKVMFSALYGCPALAPVGEREIWRYKLLPWRGPREHLLILRNPYSRLTSYFKDKFRRHPNNKCFAYHDWQDCQNLWFPHLGVTEHTPPEQIRQALLRFSFAELVETLPEVYMLEAHLHPHSWAARLRLITRLPWHVPLSFTRILRLEQREDLDVLSRMACGDVSRRPHTTAAVVADTEISGRLARTIRDVYECDFRSFNYSLVPQAISPCSTRPSGSQPWTSNTSARSVTPGASYQCM